ncbi:MAG TPA: hypothetical protein VEI49_14740 [Terriglobales bacterium]|nr:hypothetical protein [Terriglobales bacterium]
MAEQEPYLEGSIFFYVDGIAWAIQATHDLYIFSVINAYRIDVIQLVFQVASLQDAAAILM